MRTALSCLLAAALSACNALPPRAGIATLRAEVRNSPERYIIAAVDDSPIPAPPPAGGTPRGYFGVSAYGPSWHARAAMRVLEHTYGLQQVGAWPIAPLRLHCAVFKIADGADRGKVLAVMARDAQVKLAQPLQSFVTQTAPYNDPYVGLQSGLKTMNVPGAHAYSTGEGVNIAVIDTGADSRHPDLRASVAATANFVDDDMERFRRDRHGTEVAGVIAAVANNHEGIVGVAPRARLWIFKACWQITDGVDAANCNSFTLAQALAASLDAHAQIINMSLVGPYDPLLHDLMQEGLRRGVIIIGAATSAAASPPGLMQQPGILEVASVGNSHVAPSSLFAPGNEILTLLPGGRYDFASGDSIATAEVSGVVALMLSRHPGLTVDLAYRLLYDSAGGRDGVRGNSVDAAAAVLGLHNASLGDLSIPPVNQ
jgi:subtilisin family serine protease